MSSPPASLMVLDLLAVLVGPFSYFFIPFFERFSSFYPSTSLEMSLKFLELLGHAEWEGRRGSQRAPSCSALPLSPAPLSPGVLCCPGGPPGPSSASTLSSLQKIHLFNKCLLGTHYLPGTVLMLPDERTSRAIYLLICFSFPNKGKYFQGLLKAQEKCGVSRKSHRLQMSPSVQALACGTLGDS